MAHALTAERFKTPEFTNAWSSVSKFLIIRNKRDFKRTQKAFNSLLDDEADESKHKLHSYFMSMSMALSEWEEQCEPPIRKVSGGEMLGSLIEARCLKQKELTHIISQSSLSKVLNGSRELTVGQIRCLSDFFEISSDAFI